MSAGSGAPVGTPLRSGTPNRRALSEGPCAEALVGRTTRDESPATKARRLRETGTADSPPGTNLPMGSTSVAQGSHPVTSGRTDPSLRDGHGHVHDCDGHGGGHVGGDEQQRQQSTHHDQMHLPQQGHQHHQQQVMSPRTHTGHETAPTGTVEDMWRSLQDYHVHVQRVIQEQMHHLQPALPASVPAQAPMVVQQLT